MTSVHEKFQAAIQHHQANEIDVASDLYRALLKDEPHHADALHMLGIIARQKGNADLALKLTEAALAIKPDLALAWYNRSLMLRGADRSDDALQSVQQAIIHDAQLSDAWDMAGTLLREAGRLDEAATHHAKAIDLQPDNIRYRSNYAILLMSKEDLRGAYSAVRDSERLDVECLSFALGNVLRAAGYTEKAIPHYQRVSRLMPDSPEALMNEAMAWLQIGEMEQAWALWKKLPDNKESLQQIPRWQGEKVRHLLLHEEQGIGDALQCVRYIPLIRGLADKITLQLNSALQRLITFNFPDVVVITLEDVAPVADARAQLMALPALLGTTLDTIPATIPYLCVEPAWYAGQLEIVELPRIGFVWAGNPGHRNNRNRSLELKQLAPVTKAAKGHGVSLQKWRDKDVVGLEAAGLIDAEPFLTDFAATAALIMELDLIITVDTSVAHLAGALGKPVWVLVPFDPDWRWMLGREDSPWYPTLRLFRQNKPYDWDSVLTFMASELHKFLQSDYSVLEAKRLKGPPLRQNPHALDFDKKPL